MTRFVDMPSSVFNKEKKLTRSSLLNPEPGPSPYLPASPYCMALLMQTLLCSN